MSSSPEQEQDRDAWVCELDVLYAEREHLDFDIRQREQLLRELEGK